MQEELGNGQRETLSRKLFSSNLRFFFQILVNYSDKEQETPLLELKFFLVDPKTILFQMNYKPFIITKRVEGGTGQGNLQRF